MSQLLSQDRKFKPFIAQYLSPEKVQITPIEQDAGTRNYFRLYHEQETYILMHSPTGNDLKAFIQIARHLRQYGIIAPRVIGEDLSEGLLLLEDFGSLSIKNHLLQQQDSVTIQKIYYSIIDLLVAIQDLPSPAGLQKHDQAQLLKGIDTFVDWYLPYRIEQKLSATRSSEFRVLWSQILEQQRPMPLVLVHCDYHTENMMYLPNSEEGIRSIGILDFQDMMLGSPVYDLVSVLEDARIKVEQDLALDCLGYYARRKSFDLEEVRLNYHILGAQRNMRILGVFARKAVRDQDQRYLQYIPLVLSYLAQDLSHPALSELRLFLTELMP